MKENRLKNTKILVTMSGGTKNFALILDKPVSLISAIAGKNPSKNIGPRLARDIERAFGKPEGWLDEDHSIEPSSSSGIPLIALDQLGRWISAKGPKPTAKEHIDVHGTVGPRSYAIRITSGALGMLAPQGCSLVFDPDEEPISGKVAAVYLTEHEETHVGVFIKKAGKASLKFLDGSEPIPLDNYISCGRARILVSTEL